MRASKYTVPITVNYGNIGNEGTQLYAFKILLWYHCTHFRAVSGEVLGGGGWSPLRSWKKGSLPLGPLSLPGWFCINLRLPSLHNFLAVRCGWKFTHNPKEEILHRRTQWMRIHPWLCPRGLTFTWWGCYSLSLTWTNRAFPLLFILFLCLFLSYGPANCISFHQFFRQLSAFFVFFSPDIIPSCWLGSKHQLTN